MTSKLIRLKLEQKRAQSPLLWVILVFNSFLFHFSVISLFTWLFLDSQSNHNHSFQTGNIPIELIEINSKNTENSSNTTPSIKINLPPKNLAKTDTPLPNFEKISNLNTIDTPQASETESQNNEQLVDVEKNNTQLNSQLDIANINNPVSELNLPLSKTEIKQSTTITPETGAIVSNPESIGGNFIANLESPRLTVTDQDIPDQLAKPIIDSNAFNSIDYLEPLGINLTEQVILESVVIINADGTASVEFDSTQILQGNISQTQAKKLGQKIIESWHFQPTIMDNEPVAQAYFIKITARANVD